MNARSLLSSRAMRSRHAVTASTADSFRARIASASVVSVKSPRSDTVDPFHRGLGERGDSKTPGRVRALGEPAVEENPLEIVVAGPAHERVARPRGLAKITVDRRLADHGIEVRERGRDGPRDV